MRSISFAMAHSERKHYLYLCSSDSELYYPNNTATDFTVELTETLNLPGEWECSLLEIFFTKRIAGDIVRIFRFMCKLEYKQYKTSGLEISSKRNI